MFEQVFENLRQATDATIQTQAEFYKKWAGMWPTVPGAPPTWGEQAQKFQKKWSAFVSELVKKQHEKLEGHYAAGLRNLEEAFQLAEVKDLEELRTKVLELYQKSFESLREVYEAQVRDFQAAVGKWTEMMTKGAA
jgi:hypothetical protein